MKKICRNGDTIVIDKLYLHNNLWGESTGSGTQCSWIGPNTDNTESLKWKTSWNWKGSKTSIKSFASIVYGWHWGWKIRDNKLPIEIKDIKKIETSWKFELFQIAEGNLNITYDIWLSNRIIENENPDGEIMIWLYKKGKVPPIGKRQKKLIIQGSIWELWVGLHPEFKWPVFSFIRKENTTEVKMDIHQFIKEIQNNSKDSFAYLTGIQSGIEVLSGSGTFSTLDYLLELE